MKVLLITGTVGAGKTTLAREVGELLRSTGVTSAMIDLDSLSYISPGADGDRFNGRFVLKNLMAILPNYAAAGVDHLILARFLAGVAELDAYREAIPDGELFVCRVIAPAATIERRLREREHGVAQGFLLELSGHLERETAATNLEDFIVDNGDERSITEAARDVLVRAGWPSPMR